MSRARVAVLRFVSQQLSVTAAAAEYGSPAGISIVFWLPIGKEVWTRSSLARAARKRKLRRTSVLVRGRVIALRVQLRTDGLDAGPVTIAWHLERKGLRAPLDLHDPADPASGGVDHTRAAQTAPQLLHPLPSRPAQRDVAVGLHPLAASRRQRCGDPELAPSPLSGSAVPDGTI